MELIEFKGFNDNSVTLAARRIIACAKTITQDGSSKTSIFMDAQEPNDEFIVNEDYEQVAYRLRTEIYESA